MNITLDLEEYERYGRQLILEGFGLEGLHFVICVVTHTENFFKGR